MHIDDTDPVRSKPEYTEVILGVMGWLGLDWDALYYQSRRINRYLDLAHELVKNGKAFIQGDAIFLGEPSVPESWMDEISGKIAITKNDWDCMKPGYLPLMGSSFHDGKWVLDRATYHFASCVDDWDFGIDLIIRGVDHITNTSRQIAIWNALGAPIPKFAHVGLIYHNGKKLSKRDGAASMLSYKEQGYDPDAILNFMARLGWGPKVDDKSTAVLPRDKMIELFLTGGKMKNSAANMDLAKLDSFNRKYKAIKNEDKL